MTILAIFGLDNNMVNEFVLYWAPVKEPSELLAMLLEPDKSTWASLSTSPSDVLLVPVDEYKLATMLTVVCVWLVVKYWIELGFEVRLLRNVVSLSAIELITGVSEEEEALRLAERLCRLVNWAWVWLEPTVRFIELTKLALSARVVGDWSYKTTDCC